MLFWHPHVHLLLAILLATPFYIRRTWGCGLSIDDHVLQVDISFIDSLHAGILQ